MNKNNQQTQSSSLRQIILPESPTTLSWPQKIANKLGKNKGQRVSLLILLIALAMVILTTFLNVSGSGSVHYPITWFDIATYSVFILALVVRISSR